jgi:hypothetical protein
MYEVDKRAGKALEFTYVLCRIKKGSNICRYSNDVLNVYIPSSIITNSLLKEYPDIFRPFQMGNGEATLLFDETDINRVAVILKIQTRGRCQSPKPRRKLNISEEQRKIASDRMKEMQLHKKKTVLR